MGKHADWLCYIAPDGSNEAAKRIFCLRYDGCIAFTDNETGTGGRGGRALAADDVLARGGKGTLGDFPRSPTVGVDGNLWLPADLAPRATLRVMVVGDDGKRLGGIGVATTVVAPEHAIDAPLPVAFARTLREGDAELQGVPARGLGFVLTIERATVALPPAAVRIEGTTARLTVPTQSRHQARARTSESAVIATLKNLSAAQRQCQASGVIDADNNGVGEYGTFAELSGRDNVRGGKLRITPPILSTVFGEVANGVVTWRGYCFRIFLPAKDTSAVAELADGGADAKAVDAAQAETLWCAYAWPAEVGVTARAFFIDQAGHVLACPNADGRYSGVAKAPAAGAARAAGKSERLNERCAANGAGIDGQQWQIVN